MNEARKLLEKAEAGNLKDEDQEMSSPDEEEKEDHSMDLKLDEPMPKQDKGGFDPMWFNFKYPALELFPS